MSITLVLETDGGISEFIMKPISRKTRQTVRKKLAVDSQCRECSRALLTHDGLLLGSGSVADIYEDGYGNSVEHGDVVQTDHDGNVLRNLSATTGRPQRPVGPIPADELLEHTVVKAYALVHITIAHDLQASLAQGDIYRVSYRPRASVMDNPAFILANSSGAFLLQCKPCLTEFIRLDQPIVLEVDLDDEDDLWDGWSGVLLRRDEVVRKYAFTRAYQVMHTNALEFDFLYSIASYLSDRNAMVQIGSGRRGNGPLILERNGPKYRGFLDGRIQGDAMRLVLYLAALELAPPEDMP